MYYLQILIFTALELCKQCFEYHIYCIFISKWVSIYNFVLNVDRKYKYSEVLYNLLIEVLGDVES